MNRDLHRSAHAAIALCLALFGAVFLFSSVCRADALEDAARALAARVAAIPDLPASVTLVWDNHSSLTEEQSAILRRAFLAALPAGRVVTEAGASLPVLRVTLSDTPARILLIAVLQSAEASPQTEGAIFLELDRAALPSGQGPSHAVRVTGQLLWRQPEPLLAGIEWPEVAGGPASLFLLTRESLLRVALAEDGWRVKDSVPLPDSLLLPWPRPGEAGYSPVSAASPPQLQFRMNGKICAVVPGEKLLLSCEASVAGAAPEPALLAPCNMESYRLLTGGADRNEKDWIQGTEAAGGGLLTRRLELPGPVHSLTAAPAGNSAIAVVRDLSTGDYEVYRITLACGN